MTQSSRDDRPRVLHMLGSLGLGGIETWLMHLLRHQGRFAVRHELLLTNDLAGAYEDEARTLGIRIHRLSLGRGRIGWFGRFRRLLRDEGPFAVVHSHEDPRFAALLLAAAAAAGVPARIAHSHSARSRGRDYPASRRLARRCAMPLLRRAATRVIGVSEEAIAEIAGARWRALPRCEILDYGFDFAAFHGAAARGAALRARLAIPPGAAVIGNVARMMPVKNHDVLVRAFAVARERVPEARLVLVGEGPLRAELERLVAGLGLGDFVVFAGPTDDAAAFMAMFDLFVLPSFSEGLGIVCVEAQAAGTPLLISDTVPAEALVVPGAAARLSPLAPAERWGAAMADALAAPRRVDRGDWLRQMEASRFGLDQCIDRLDAIYRRAAAASLSQA